MKEASGAIKSHRDLLVWQKGIKLVLHLYQTVKEFPKDQIYGLVSQIKRAAVSIPANIAEGQGRRLKGEYQQFLGNGRGSLLELDTHIEIAFQLNFITQENYLRIRAEMDEIGRMLNGLMRAIANS